MKCILSERKCILRGMKCILSERQSVLNKRKRILSKRKRILSKKKRKKHFMLATKCFRGMSVLQLPKGGTFQRALIVGFASPTKALLLCDVFICSLIFFQVFHNLDLDQNFQCQILNQLCDFDYTQNRFQQNLLFYYFF